ncbi:hypothetical protein NMG60_11024294 [Bertholletia excelsa]
MGTLQLTVILLVIIEGSDAAVAELDGDQWKPATATYSNQTNGSIVTEGACGYGDLHRSSYGEYSAGLSSMLFNRGSRCGGCFEVRCVDHIKWCLMRSPSVILTTTDFCPLSAELRASGRLRRLVQLSPSTFSLSEAAFAQIAHRGANIVPVQYLRFTVYGTSSFCQVLITNVGSDGEVVAAKVNGSKTGWIPKGRNWGQNWQSNVNLAGQPLFFEVTTSTGRTITSYNVAPAKWRFGQTFQGKQF